MCTEKWWDTFFLMLLIQSMEAVWRRDIYAQLNSPIRILKFINAVCIQRVMRPTNVNNYNTTNISDSQNGAGRFNLGGRRLCSSSFWCTASCSLPTELPQGCPPLSGAHRYDIMAASSAPRFLWTVTVTFLSQVNSHFLDIFYIKSVLFPSNCFFSIVKSD